MKIAQALQKNSKLLFRSRETAFTIIFGPLLIILLVGFAFSGEAELDIALGVQSDNYTLLADSIVQTLQEEYDVNVWGTGQNAECLDQVKVGITHMCIVFPEDFEVREEHTNIVTFNVDPSRINFVYQVIEQLGNQFDVQREELSLGLTGDILNNLNATKTILADQTDNVEDVQNMRDITEKLLTNTDGRLETQEINFSILDLRLLRGESTSISQDAQQLFDIIIEELDEALSVLRDIESQCDDCENSTKEQIDAARSAFNDAQDEARSIHDNTPEKLQNIYSMIDDANQRLNQITEEFNSVQQDASFVREQTDGALGSLDTMKGMLTELRANLRFASDLLDGVAVADSESIVSPIRTDIQEVTAETGNLTFTYPYILMLVIMFMGLMLGSTLIVTDKNSRAAFRNFTTATRDEFNILMSFITTLCILLAQVLVILLFSYFLVPAPLLNNFGTSFLVILLAITLFSFIGMMIGFLAHSQEASMISSLTAGSIMLFVSNLVIPTEGMKAVVQAIASINPYVLLSEILKKSMLFGVDIGEFGGQLGIVIVLLIILLIIVFTTQHYVRKRYFRQQTVEPVVKKKGVKPLHLGTSVIKNEFELLTALDLMTRKEFKEYVNEKKNVIHQWVLKESENKKLHRILKTTSKEKMILKLDKHLKKRSKK